MPKEIVVTAVAYDHRSRSDEEWEEELRRFIEDGLDADIVHMQVEGADV